MSAIISDGMPAEAFWDVMDSQRPQGVPVIDTGMKHEPGIFFGMPEEEYHSIPALSASGMKNLLISNMDFWANSWMNPAYEGKETSALALGSGYGVRICEGKEAFYSRTTYAFDKADYPDALDTKEDLHARLDQLGVKFLKSAKKSDLVAKVLEAQPDAQILDDLKSEYYREHEGMTFLSSSEIHEIEIAARMIDFDPVASKCFKGGYPEVTVIWIDQTTGVPMKARFDYLKIGAIIDLKSFSNSQGKSLTNAIASAMASRKYHIQAANYVEADQQAMRFVAQGRVFGDVDPEWLKAYAAFRPDGGPEPDGRQFIFVWQQTGIAPVTRVKPFSRVLEMFKAGTAAVQDARHKFAECWHHYGTDPWLDVREMEQFEDIDFPLFMLEV